MNININQLLKSIIDTADVKSLELRDSMRIFLLQHKQENLNTYNYYKRKLNKIISFFEERGIFRTNQITSNALQDYISFRVGKIKAATLNKEVGALITMLNYLDELDLIQKPDLKFKKFKEDDILRVFLEPEQVNELYEYINSQSLKKQIVIHLMIETGVRRTEITRIQLKNISFDEDSIYLTNLQTKAKKGRFLYILPETKELIIQYLKSYKPTVYLLETSEGSPMKPSAITSILARIKEDLNLTDLSPHILRRTF
ncbi:MAG TPA: tyrosine-type recombinase/integrase, partial [Candidatus Pelethenecus sp.]|nr:tyrosine-type recombinase/integrase [Candidatus Pelethenecus sp.]